MTAKVVDFEQEHLLRLQTGLASCADSFQDARSSLSACSSILRSVTKSTASTQSRSTGTQARFLDEIHHLKEDLLAGEAASAEQLSRLRDALVAATNDAVGGLKAASSAAARARRQHADIFPLYQLQNALRETVESLLLVEKVDIEETTKGEILGDLLVLSATLDDALVDGTSQGSPADTKHNSGDRWIATVLQRLTKKLAVSSSSSGSTSSTASSARPRISPVVLMSRFLVGHRPIRHELQAAKANEAEDHFAQWPADVAWRRILEGRCGHGGAGVQQEIVNLQSVKEPSSSSNVNLLTDQLRFVDLCMSSLTTGASRSKEAIRLLKQLQGAVQRGELVLRQKFAVDIAIQLFAVVVVGSGGCGPHSQHQTSKNYSALALVVEQEQATSTKAKKTARTSIPPLKIIDDEQAGDVEDDDENQNGLRVVANVDDGAIGDDAEEMLPSLSSLFTMSSGRKAFRPEGQPSSSSDLEDISDSTSSIPESSSTGENVNDSGGSATRENRLQTLRKILSHARQQTLLIGRPSASASSKKGVEGPSHRIKQKQTVDALCNIDQATAMLNEIRQSQSNPSPFWSTLCDQSRWTLALNDDLARMGVYGLCATEYPFLLRGLLSDDSSTSSPKDNKSYFQIFLEELDALGVLLDRTEDL
ncbi:unnamed protein product [Amoebophrya sp. A25]|nr:unnamed protein product [Amoebophrya sp. A25]|eukprot:GSA25T00019322001.1